MATCNEQFGEFILRIYPIASGQLTFSLPETVKKDIIQPSDIGMSDTATLQAWLATKKRFTELEENNAIELSQPATITTKSDIDISGYESIHSIELKTRFYGETERSIIQQLEQNNNDFIIESEDGNYYLLRYFSPGQITTKSIIQDDSNHGVMITITNRNITGLQTIAYVGN